MRTMILKGKLPFPSIERVEEVLGSDIAQFGKKFFSAIWHNYLINKGAVSSSYWHDQLNNPKAFNILVVSLAKAGWIISNAIPERNWLEISLNEKKLLEFVSLEEIEIVRAEFKFQKYRLRNDEAVENDLVRANGKVTRTGLIREGFKLAANTEFYYDKQMLRRYEDSILKNLTKSMSKIREKYPEMGASMADYDAISEDILHWLNNHNGMFKRGTTHIDSRGRAISSSLGKVANPIGNKDFRALLVIPEQYRTKATQRGVDAICLFIAELNGCKKAESREAKLQYGMYCWLTGKTHDLNLSEEGDRTDLFEHMWLQRLYAELDGCYGLAGVEGALAKELATINGVANFDVDENWMWSTPVELDAGASMLQYAAMLLNDRTLADMTNMIEGELTDPWHIDGLSRNMVKKAATPMLYGSTKTATDLWKQNGMKYTVDDAQCYNKALGGDGLGLANKFKEFILNHCQPKEAMHVTIWNDSFDIQCNRYRQVGDQTRLYKVYDSDTKMVKSVYHTTTKKVADLEQFKRYFQTLLVF